MIADLWKRLFFNPHRICNAAAGLEIICADHRIIAGAAVKELHKQINDNAKAHFDSFYIDLLPDMEEYRVVPEEEAKARRYELIRYLEEKEKKKQ